MISIIDTNEPLNAAELDELWNGGTRSIGRYLNRRNPGERKVIQPAEARLFAARGMRLISIYEFDGKPSGSAIGTLDGEWAAQYLPTIGAPQGAFVAYTVDYDASESDMPGIRAAFAAVAAALAPKFTVWAYGSGAVCAELWAAKLISGRWLSCSGGFRGTKQALAAGDYEMRQALPSEAAGVASDPDTAHVATMPIGFIPFAAAEPLAASVPPSIEANASVVAMWEREIENMLIRFSPNGARG